MAVIATPVNHVIAQCCDQGASAATVNPVDCVGQNVLSVDVSRVNGEAVTARIRAISVAQGVTSTLSWQLHDKNGAPLNLTNCVNGTEESPYKIVFRLKEYVNAGTARPVFQVDATVTDATNGKISVTLSAEMTKLPGIYYADFCMAGNTEENNGQVVFVNTCYLIINRSTLYDAATDFGGPPSIAEIRLHLRDSSPAESFLLDNLMFDDAEIALAISRPVQYWNEVPPPLNQTYNTQTFPFRYHWLEGICANLFFMVAEQFRRNQLPYSAGGISVDDQNKEANYERAGQIRWQAYKEWVRATKAAINLESCWGSVTSNYKYSAYTDAIRIRY